MHRTCHRCGGLGLRTPPAERWRRAGRTHRGSVGRPEEAASNCTEVRSRKKNNKKRIPSGNYDPKWSPIRKKKRQTAQMEGRIYCPMDPLGWMRMNTSGRRTHDPPKQPKWFGGVHVVICKGSTLNDMTLYMLLTGSSA